jgi:hypothetical protein
MGQRHQVYVALPTDHPLYKKGQKVIGLHHQWLYGHTAAHQLARLLTFIKKSGSSLSHPFLSGFDDPLSILKAIYSCDPEEGYFSNVYGFEGSETECCVDPLLGNNNDGITVVDLRGFSFKDGKLKGLGKIAYAFVSLGHKDFPENVPLSAREYVNGYYDTVALTRAGSSLTTTDAHGKKVRNEAEARVREVEALKFSVMTQEALTEIFPTLRAPAASSLLLGQDALAV